MSKSTHEFIVWSQEYHISLKKIDIWLTYSLIGPRSTIFLQTCINRLMINCNKLITYIMVNVFLKYSFFLFSPIILVNMFFRTRKVKLKEKEKDKRWFHFILTLLGIMFLQSLISGSWCYILIPILFTKSYLLSLLKTKK